MSEEPVLAFLPASAQTQDHAPAAQVIQGGRLARQQRGMAEGEWRHQRAEVDPLGVVRQIRQRDDQLERVFVGRLSVGEVIGAEEAGEPQRLHIGDEPLPPRPRQAVLSLDHDRERYHA